MYTNRSISRVLAAAVASAGFAVPVPTIAASLTCTAGTFSATPVNGNIVVSCTSPSTTPTCSLTASPTLVSASGGTVTLAASNCGTISSWTKAGSSVGQTASSWQDSFPANGGTSTISYTYTVNGAGGSDSVTVSQSGTGGSTPPPPLPGGAISCAGYSKTIVLDLPWGQPGSAAPRLVSSGFNYDSVVVARFTTPASTASNVFAQIKAAEWGDQQALRTAALSTSPCDFPSPNPLGRYASVMTGTPSPSVNYAVGGSSSLYAILKPSTTYYFNIRNYAFGAKTCTSGKCDIFVELQRPNGL